MTTGKEKLALIINTAAYDRVAFAFNVAKSAAVVGKEVAMLFGYGGLVRLRKGHIDDVGDETEAWIREQLKAGVEKGSVPRISEEMATFRMLGGKLYACPAAMALHNLIKDELIEEVSEVCSVASFLSQNLQGTSALIYI